MGRFELPEERGQKTHVSTGRARRLLKLGNLAASVSSRVVTNRLRRAFLSEEEADRRRPEELRRLAERIVSTMGEMKGAAMKVGQMLSQGGEGLPEEFTQVLAKLQSDAPPMDFPMVRGQIESAFDLPIHEVFATFDYRPVASASIGQVHRATLHDGSTVAVKVQYPGVADSMGADLDNMRMLMRLAKVVGKGELADEYHAEVRSVLEAELDYEREARNIERFRGLFAADELVRVPRVHMDLTRPTVLTMEFLEGEKLDAYLERGISAAERNRTAMLIFEVFARMFHELHLLHADPHPGNYLLDGDGKLVLLDYGCVRDFEPTLTDGFLRLVAASRREAWDELPGLYEAVGFRNVRRVPTDKLAEFTRTILAPYLADGSFRFGSWDVQRQVARFFQQNLSFLNMHPPSDGLFFFRTCAGLLGHVQRLDAEGDWATVIGDIMQRRGVVH